MNALLFLNMWLIYYLKNDSLIASKIRRFQNPELSSQKRFQIIETALYFFPFTYSRSTVDESVSSIPIKKTKVM